MNHVTRNSWPLTHKLVVDGGDGGCHEAKDVGNGYVGLGPDGLGDAVQGVSDFKVLIVQPHGGAELCGREGVVGVIRRDV